MNFTCPKCASEQTQKVSVLVAAGSTGGLLGGTSLSYNIRDGLSVGSHAGRISSQTALAQRLSPGRRPSQEAGLHVGGIVCLSLGLLFSVCGYVMIGPTVLVMMALGGTLGIIGLVLYLAYAMGASKRRRATEDWERRDRYLSIAWFCHRCGHDWMPGLPGQEMLRGPNERIEEDFIA